MSIFKVVTFQDLANRSGTVAENAERLLNQLSTKAMDTPDVQWLINKNYIVCVIMWRQHEHDPSEEAIR